MSNFVTCANPGCFNGRIDCNGRKVAAEFEVLPSLLTKEKHYCSLDCFQVAASQIEFNNLVAIVEWEKTPK